MKAGMKCILTIIGVIVLVGIAATNADAKSPGEIWHRTYDGGNDDEAYGVAVDSGDNITVTGRSNSGVNYDYYIIKYNSSGNELWNATYDGGSVDFANGVAADSSDNIIVTGMSNLGGDTDYYTIKYYGSNGTEIWNVTYDGGSIDGATGVAVDSSDNIIVTGSSDLSGDRDYYTIKYDSSGNEIWNATYDGGSIDFANGVAVDSGDNIIVTGRSNLSGNFYDYCTVKYYGSNGTEIWNVTYDAGDFDGAYGVAVDSSDNIIVTGESNVGGNINYYTIKYDSNGNELWNVTYDGGGVDKARAVAVGSGDNITVTGESNLGGNLDYYTIKYDSSGNELLSVAYNGGLQINDYAHGVAVDSSDNIIVTGESEESYAAYTYDYHTIKYGPPTVHNINKGRWYYYIQDAIDDANDNDTIKVYPGTYTENLEIYKPLKLVGDPIIDGSGNIGINITANNTHVENMTVTNCSTGILVHNDSFTVQNVTLFNITIGDTVDECESGIQFDDVTASRVNKSEIYNISSNSVAYGIYLWDSHNNSFNSTFIENVTALNDVAYGIHLNNSNYNSLTDPNINDIQGDGYAYGVRLWDSDNNTFDPTVVENVTALNDYAYGVSLKYSNNNTFDTTVIDNITAMNNGARGIHLLESNDNNFTNSSISDIEGNSDACGIKLWDSGNNTFDPTVIDNITGVNDNAYGIFIYGLNDNNFTDVKINDTEAYVDAYGIWIYESDYNRFTDTTISDVEGNGSAYGVKLYGSNNNTFDPTAIEDVTALNYGACGIFLGEFSDDNSFTDTSISNVKGNSSAYGIYIDQYSNNNIFDPTIIENVDAVNDNAYGIYLYTADGNSFIDTSIRNVRGNQSTYGMYLDESDNNAFDPTIIWNVNAVNDNAYGVFLGGSNDNSFIETKIRMVRSSASDYYGFRLDVSSRNEILDGEIVHCGHGIWIESGNNNTIERNIIEYNTLFGTGAHLESGAVYTEIHWNCFIDNILQAWDNGTNNNWDNNYWSDYPVRGGTYNILGNAASKDYSTLRNCQLRAAQVPILAPIGILLLIGLITVCAVITINKKHH